MTLPPLHEASVASALAVIARAVLGVNTSPATSVGSVVLLPHQSDAVRRLRDLMARYGGALLCDEPGVGKTYVALTLAAAEERTLVVAPAGLRAMWRDAARRAAVALDFASVESLGRGTEPAPASLVIVDEAHHLRNPSTRRYDVAARLCATGRTLLLTATPLHNARADVAALAALFAGVRAYAWSDDEIARVTVRRTVAATAPARLPAVERGPWCVLDSCDATVLDAIAALPPPVPARDGAVAAALVAVSLARQWASSAAALHGALRRRIARGHALLHALANGVHPTRAELGAWAGDEHAVQLALVPLVASATHRADAASADELHATLTAHVDALAMLERRMRPHADARLHPDDLARAHLLRTIRRRHAPERVVVFTAYADTASALYAALRNDGHVALLTARGGCVAGGALSRDEILARFASAPDGARECAPHERIELLISTDLLSEGVNLQSAQALVHLDLPWTSARLAQRIGRVARVGSPHDRIVSYALRPPERAEAFVRSLATIAAKARLAADLLGAGDLLPEGDPTPNHPSVGAVGVAEALRTRLAHWAGHPCETTAVPVAHVPAAVRCALALCFRGTTPELVTLHPDGQVNAGAAHAEPLVREAERATVAGDESVNTPAGLDARLVAGLLDRIRRWDAARSAATDAGLSTLERTPRPIPDVAAQARTKRLRAAAARLSQTPFAQRTAAAALVSHVCHVADAGAPIGLERSFYSPHPDQVAAALAAGTANGRLPALSVENALADEFIPARQPLELGALLLFGPTG